MSAATAMLATALLLATPSMATPSTLETIDESSEAHTIQLRGSSDNSSSSSRSLAALAPTQAPSVTANTNRFAKNRNRRPQSLPVSPGIAKGVDAEDLPCLVATICEQPQLSILCGFVTANLEEWSGPNNFFVEESEGTFFAPLDGAFEGFGTLLSSILANDLADPSIVENVLSYHAAPIDATPNVTDLVVSLEDLECNGELAMANGEMTTTLCLDEVTKCLIGPGNRPMRTLPEISGEGIETCDGAVIMYFVDQLILPPSPLSGMPDREPERPQSGDNGVCPIERPALDSSCQDTGQPCRYNYAYDGCTWRQLECKPTMTCFCSNVDETGFGSWMCISNIRSTCLNLDPVVTIANDFEERDFSDSIRPPVETSASLPRGDCDPNEPLPSPPAPQECPVEKSESCLGYDVGQTCEFGHMYLGCTWEDLTCTFIEKCTCAMDGQWSCMMRGVAPCGTVEAGVGWVDTTPEGLPWGEVCNPDDELPTPPLPSGEEDIEDEDDEGALASRLSEECPPSADFGFCDGFVPNLPCNYNYRYNGCTWDTLVCVSIMRCECNMFKDGKWACSTEAWMTCPERKPEGHPRGMKCDPNDPLPLPPTATTTTTVTAVASSASTTTKNEGVALSLMSGGIRR